MRKPNNPARKGRRGYRAPRLVRVALVPEEATLTSCKTATVSGPTGMAGKCLANPAVCSHAGS